MNYDALLLVSFGGPEKPDDVMPFLENVVRGKNVPRERLLGVADHYYHFGGKSPINDQNRALIAALEREVRLPIYWGNRNWHPLLADTLRQMKTNGVRRALAIATSAFGSYSGCRQYLEDIDRARAEVGADAPEIDKLPPFYHHPGFLDAQAERVREALGRVSDSAALVFTAHSVPVSMAAASPYVAQLEEARGAICELLGRKSSALVYQSRSGLPSQPWLAPDICDYIRGLEGVTELVVVPLGFLSDHLEVLWDLDNEAAGVAESLGIRMVRAGTVGAHPVFVAALRDLIESAIRSAGPGVCPPDCCPPAPRRA